MKLRNLILVGALVFLWALLVNAPAASLNAWFAAKLAPVTLYGVEGSIAEGSTQSLSLNGRPLVQNLRWSFQPWWLPLLRASFHVDGGNQDLSLKGRVAWVWGGINASGLEGGGSVKGDSLKWMLGQLYPGFSFLPLDGLAKFDIRDLKIRHGFPSVVSGAIELRGLALTLGKDPMPLGDFKATLSTEKPATGTPGSDSIKVVIETLGGQVDANGEVHLNPDRSYDYDLQIKAKDNAAQALRDMIQAAGLGNPDTRGYYHARNRGNLASGGNAPAAVATQAPPAPMALRQGQAAPPVQQHDPNTSVTGLPVE